MGNFIFRAGAYAVKLLGGFFKGVPPGQAAGLIGGGITIGGLWDTVTGWFDDSVNTGTDQGSQGVMGTIEEAWSKATTAVQVAGFLFVSLVLVLGYKSFKRALK